MITLAADPTPSALRPGEPETGTGRSGAGPARAWSIDEIVEQRAVRTLFQPIVRLATSQVVGFEALSRGPVGSTFESPIALLDAAGRAGRLGELDWICRAHAMRSAAASGLPADLSWFVNIEPAGLGTACPDDLLPALTRARRELRVVLEVVERCGESHVPQLLELARRARADAWRVALDDVGVEPASLGLLPVLQPNVVKLDMSLLHGDDPATAHHVAATVRAYAERRGAAVLAEGIETAAQERLALALGAEYGQGFRYGRPGALPVSLPAPHRVAAPRHPSWWAACSGAHRRSVSPRRSIEIGFAR